MCEIFVFFAFSSIWGSSGKCVPIWSDLTAESAEETQKHTEKKKKEEKRE